MNHSSFSSIHSLHMFPKAHDLFVSFCSWSWKTLPLPVICFFTTGWSISLNNRIASLFKPIKALPNFNKRFNRRARWFVECPDRTKDDHVMVYCHGGGYCIGLLPQFVISVWAVYQTMQDERLSILIVDYSVLKGKAALDDLVEVYEQLRSTSSKITLFGESAGGHLCLWLLKYYSMMKTEEQEDNMKELYGMLLFSPWTVLEPEEKGSYQIYKETDMLSAAVLTKMAHKALGDLLKTDDLNPMNWDLKLPRRTLITHGSSEVMRDDLEKFCARNGVKPLVDDIRQIHDSVCFYSDFALVAAEKYRDM